MLEKRRGREGNTIDRNTGNKVRERKTQRGLCAGALLNQPCNAGFYRKASLDSCDKWQASLIRTWKSTSARWRERKGGEEGGKRGKKRIKSGNVFKEINFPLPGELLGLLMREKASEEVRAEWPRTLYSHSCAVRAASLVCYYYFNHSSLKKWCSKKTEHEEKRSFWSIIESNKSSRLGTKCVLDVRATFKLTHHRKYI